MQEIETVSERPSSSQINSVSDCGLRLTKVRLLSLICTPGDMRGDIPPATLKCQGELREGSLDENGFLSVVSWSLEFPKGAASPISISGRHELTFTVKEPIADSVAKYYSEINSVILVYPYIRQIIDELTVKCLGRNVMIRPLDVPKFVKEKTHPEKEFRSDEVIEKEENKKRVDSDVQENLR